MAFKRYKPNTPGQRKKTSIIHEDITTSTPEKSLTKNLNRSHGRDSKGHITVSHHGGGVRRRYRLIDFKRKEGVEGKIVSIEYDPNRSSLISLVSYKDGDKRYILTAKGQKVGDVVQAGEAVDINTGNAMPLKSIPVGAKIHNIELVPGKGAQLVRTAGVTAILMAKTTKYATVKLPSGEIRLIHILCTATYGELANEHHNNRRHGKAGIKRKLNIRPTVRGAAKNACDHKHGGGEGKAPVGLSEPRTAYGKKGNIKTRRKRNVAKHVVRARKKRGR
jgi:large subunit ribosomal protein L2